jgi:hypothetical protein
MPNRIGYGEGEGELKEVKELEDSRSAFGPGREVGNVGERRPRS